jgi:hypothetical protein
MEKTMKLTNITEVKFFQVVHVDKTPLQKVHHTQYEIDYIPELDLISIRDRKNLSAQPALVNRMNISYIKADVSPSSPLEEKKSNDLPKKSNDLPISQKGPRKK